MSPRHSRTWFTRLAAPLLTLGLVAGGFTTESRAFVVLLDDFADHDVEIHLLGTINHHPLQSQAFRLAHESRSPMMRFNTGRSAA